MTSSVATWGVYPPDEPVLGADAPPLLFGGRLPPPLDPPPPLDEPLGPDVFAVVPPGFVAVVVAGVNGGF